VRPQHTEHSPGLRYDDRADFVRIPQSWRSANVDSIDLVAASLVIVAVGFLRALGGRCGTLRSWTSLRAMMAMVILLKESIFGAVQSQGLLDLSAASAGRRVLVAKMRLLLPNIEVDSLF
jgi:hypothetical protein